MSKASEYVCKMVKEACDKNEIFNVMEAMHKISEFVCVFEKDRIYRNNLMPEQTLCDHINTVMKFFHDNKIIDGKFNDEIKVETLKNITNVSSWDVFWEAFRFLFTHFKSFLNSDYKAERNLKCKRIGSFLKSLKVTNDKANKNASKKSSVFSLIQDVKSTMPECYQHYSR